MCGILSEFVEAKGDTAKKPKSDKWYFRVWIRNVDRECRLIARQLDKIQALLENFRKDSSGGCCKKVLGRGIIKL